MYIWARYPFEQLNIQLFWEIFALTYKWYKCVLTLTLTLSAIAHTPIIKEGVTMIILCALSMPLKKVFGYATEQSYLTPLRWRVSKSHYACEWHNNYWLLHRSCVNSDFWTREVSRKSAATPRTLLATVGRPIGSSLEKSIEKWKD